VWQGAGIGRYTRELVRSAVALGGPFHYVLFYAAGGLPADSPYLADVRKLCANYAHVRAVAIHLSPRLLTIVWQRLRLPLYAEVFTGPLDVLHAPDFVLPPTRARTLLTIHDLTFLVYPHCFEPSLARYLRRAVPRHLRRANLVLADSQATRNDLVRLVRVAPERIVVVYPGVREQFRPRSSASTEAVRQRLGLPPEFLLFVGTLEPRKNIVCLLEAYHQLRTRGHSVPPLVIAGRKGWLYQNIFETVERLGLQSHVIFLDFVADEDLPALYSMARVFVYPSLYEGFGLPVVEALACGTPVVTTRVASLPEVAGDAAILVNPLEPDAIADGIQQALARAPALRAAAPGAARRFTWEQSGRALLACYLAARDGGA
jgi:glycosyltransferase involved in cell wall biosynthesis